MTHKQKDIKELGGSIYSVLIFQTKAKALITQMHWLLGRHIYPQQLKGWYYGNVVLETSCAFILWLDTCDNSQALHGITGMLQHPH